MSPEPSVHKLAEALADFGARRRAAARGGRGAGDPAERAAAGGAADGGPRRGGCGAVRTVPAGRRGPSRPSDAAVRAGAGSAAGGPGRRAVGTCAVRTGVACTDDCVRILSRRAAPAAAHHPGDAAHGRRDPAAPRRPDPPRVRAGGHQRARADLGDARASCSTPGTRLRKAAVEAVEAGVAGIMLFGVPEDAKKDAARDRRAPTRTGSCRSPSGTCGPRSATTCVVMSDLCLDEYTDHGHCGVLDARRPRRQRRHAGAVRRDGPGPGRRRRPCGRAQRDDGRPGRRRPRRAGPDRARGRRRSSPTPRSTPPPSTGPSGRPSAPR